MAPPHVPKTSNQATTGKAASKTHASVSKAGVCKTANTKSPNLSESKIAANIIERSRIILNNSIDPNETLNSKEIVNNARSKGTTTEVATSELSTLMISESINPHNTPIRRRGDGTLSILDRPIEKHLCIDGEVESIIVKAPDGGLKIDDLVISLHRTVRVADNGTPSKLPPDLGPFTLYRDNSEQEGAAWTTDRDHFFLMGIYSR